MASTTPHNPIVAVFLLPLLIPILSTEAQSPPIQTSDNQTSDPQTPKFQPTTAIIIATLISAAILLGLYAYSRNCLSDGQNLFEAAAASLSARRKPGLDPAVLHSLPTMLYSDVKHHQIGSSSLECAVCLNEFEDDDSLRLLPKCSHAFHEDCIDAWLASHVTCPVCRAVLEEKAGEAAAVTAAVSEEEQVAVVVVVMEDEEQRRKERKELARIASRTKRGGAKRQRRLMRSHTTGHIEEDLERYTLRLPENVRNDIIAATRLRRERSLPARGTKGGGEGGFGGRRSLMVGLSAKWPSFFLRSWSAKGLPAGGSKRLDDGPVKPDLPL